MKTPRQMKLNSSKYFLNTTRNARGCVIFETIDAANNAWGDVWCSVTREIRYPGCERVSCTLFSWNLCQIKEASEMTRKLKPKLNKLIKLKTNKVHHHWYMVTDDSSVTIYWSDDNHFLIICQQRDKQTNNRITNRQTKN